MSDKKWTAFFNQLDVEGSPTAYVFRCLHCGAFDVHWDWD
ncbi:CbrC family protein [Methylocystis heyeri]